MGRHATLVTSFFVFTACSAAWAAEPQIWPSLRSAAQSLASQVAADLRVAPDGTKSVCLVPQQGHKNSGEPDQATVAIGVALEKKGPEGYRIMAGAVDLTLSGK